MIWGGKKDKRFLSFLVVKVFKETGAASVGGGHEPDKLTFSELCGFIVQLVELYTSIAEVRIMIKQGDILR